jgi:hypothetical protein
LSKNIYNLFREYNKLSTQTQKSKYLASLNFDTRETFKSLIEYANNSDRFENIYDGWIESLEEELVVLEVYNVILNTRRSLNKFCVDDKKYKEFISHKKKMLLLLLENKQYKHASSLLDVYMFSKEFEQEKLKELREKALNYLVSKKMVLPKKLINEIYEWVDGLVIPPYFSTDIDGDFKFPITYDVIPIATLRDDVEKALENSGDLKKIVDNLVKHNSVD